MRWLLILALLFPSMVNAQQAVWTNARGATTSGYPTSTIYDADHRLLDIRCWVGCGAAATQDVNVTQLLGAAPSATNPFASRLTNGTIFIDPRDRNWTLSSGTDSVAVTGSVTANAGTNLNTSALFLDATFTGRVNTQGQKTMAASTPVVLPSDQSAVPISGTVTVGTFPDNEPINVAQINGVAVTMGNGASGTGVQRVTIADNSTGTVAATQATAANLNMRPDTSGATAAAPPARANFAGAIASGATGGLIQGITVCDSFANVNIVTATTTLIVTGVSGRHVRICGLSMVTAGANNVALISGTGATCGTGTTGMTGGTTAATGYNFAANAGIAHGSGVGEINRTNATGDSVCIITSAAVQLSGRVAYAIY